jgi:hypothetical protein
MAVKFEETAYESDLGFVCKIRMSVDEFAATTESVAAIDAGFHCLNSGSRRRFGVHPRGVVLTRVAGVAPETFKKSTFLAFPTAAGWNAVAENDPIVIGATSWTVSKKVKEELT